MSYIFTRQSHLNHLKVFMGLHTTQGHANANAYVCEQRLKKVIKARVDEQLWLRFKRKRKYTPSWLVTFDRFMNKLVWYIEKDRSPAKSLEYFNQNGIEMLISKYIKK